MRSNAVGREAGGSRPADLARYTDMVLWLLEGARAPHASHFLRVSATASFMQAGSVMTMADQLQLVMHVCV